MREVPAWVGSSDDAKVPPRVRLRIFERYEGRCYLSGRKINAGDKWELEHIVALCNGGAHAESNLAPALAGPHKIKTAADVKEKSKVARVKKKHLGLLKPKRKIDGRKFDGTPSPARDR